MAGSIFSKFKLPRQLLISLLTAGSAAVLQVISFALTSRALGPEAFGLMSVIFATSMLFSPLGSLGADQTIVRSLSRETASYQEAWGHVLVMLAVMFPIAWLAALGLTHLTFQGDLAFAVIAAAIAGEMLIGRAVTAASASFVAHGMVIRASLVEFGVVVLRFLAVIVVFWLLESRDLSLWLTVTAAQAIATSIAVAILLSVMFGAPKLRLIKSDLGFGVWMMFNLFLQTAQSNVDKIILGQLVPTRQLGVYSAGTRLSLLGNLGGLWVARMYNPGYFKSQMRGNQELLAYARSCVPVTLAVGVLSSLAMAGFAFALPLLVGEGYNGVTQVGLVVALVPLAGCLRIPAADALTAMDRQRLRTAIFAAALIFLIAAIYFGVSAIGVIGAAWALVVTSALTTAVLWLFFLKLVRG